MTDEKPHPGPVQYFRSFSAHQQPVLPLNPIAYSQAEQLSTWYEAHYDDQRKLIKFIKKLRVNDNQPVQWQDVFTEVYQYFENGGLRQRKLRIPGQADQIWDFDEKQQSWSGFFERFCQQWFRRTRSNQQPAAARISLLVHELFSEMELQAFEASVGVPRDSEWAYRTVERTLNGTREIIEQIDPLAAPRISVVSLAREQSEPIVWKGFDEPEFGLHRVVESWQAKHPGVGDFETITLTDRDLDAEDRGWAAQAKITSIAFAPIRIVDGDKLATGVMLLLTIEQAMNDDNLCMVTSIFRRLLLHIQSTLDTARVHHGSVDGDQWPLLKPHRN